jgi:hypothetical protein
MSANLEKAIQEELSQLTDDQQQQVMAFVESLKPKSRGKTESPIRLLVLLTAAMVRFQLRQNQSLTRLPIVVKDGVCFNGRSELLRDRALISNWSEEITKTLF